MFSTIEKIYLMLNSTGILLMLLTLNDKNHRKIAKYVCRRTIFGTCAMGRDAGHYCDVQSSSINLSLVKIKDPSFYSNHQPFIVQDLEYKLAASYQCVASNLLSCGSLSLYVIHSIKMRLLCKTPN